MKLGCGKFTICKEVALIFLNSESIVSSLNTLLKVDPCFAIPCLVLC